MLIIVVFLCRILKIERGDFFMDKLLKVLKIGAAASCTLFWLTKWVILLIVFF